MATEEGSSGLSTPCSSTSSQSEEVGSFSDESVDEGESEWDVLGRMNSLRRSSLFDKPHFTKVTLTRTPAGYGLELQGSSPAVISHVCDTTPTCLLNLAFPLLPTVQLGPRLRGHVCMRETECWRSMV
jgi:hypothetical protein